MKKFLYTLLAIAFLAAFAFGVFAPSTPRDEGPGADVDLTRFAGTMAYAFLSNIVTEPGPYVGRTIKLRGLFVSFRDLEGELYCGISFMDPAACCAVWLGCVLKAGQEYPKAGEDVTVVGKFDVLRSGEGESCRLIDAEIL